MPPLLDEIIASRFEESNSASKDSQMEHSAIEQRQHYESDGGLAPVKLVLTSPILAIGVAVVGFLLALCYHWNFYLIILMPAIGGALVGGATFLWTSVSHCRNQWMAASLGAVSGFLAYVLHFYFCLCFEVNFQALPPLDSLPAYIEFRLHNDVQEDVARPNFGNKRDPSVVMNTFLAFGETLFMVLIPVAAGWNRAQRAYSTSQLKWYSQEKMLLQPYVGPAIQEALEFGTLAQFLRQHQPCPPAPVCCEVTVEYLLDEKGGVSEEPVYLTVKDHPPVKPWYRPAHVKSRILKHVELATPEILALSAVFSKLALACKRSEGELAAQPASPLPEVRGPQSEQREVTEVATVTPVAEPYRQRVRTKAYPWLVNLRDLIPIAFLFGGVGVGVFGGFMIEKNRIPEGAGLIATGVAAAAWGIYTAKFCISVYGNRWVKSRLRTELKRRPESLVDLDDPSTRYITIIPRDSFIKIKLVFSSDVGLLQIDESQRQVRIDCDLDQYVIPADAIESCGPQCFFAPFDHGKTTEIWVAQLLVRFPEDTREILLSAGQTTFRPVTNNSRRKLANEFCDQISSLLGTKQRSKGRSATQVTYRHIADR